MYLHTPIICIPLYVINVIIKIIYVSDRNSIKNIFYLVSSIYPFLLFNKSHWNLYRSFDREFIPVVCKLYTIAVDNFMARGHLFHLGSLMYTIPITCRYRACPYNTRSINLRRNIEIARTDGEINIQWIMRAARTYLVRLRCRSTLPYVIYSELNVAGTRQLLRDTRAVIWHLQRRMTLSGKTCSSNIRETRVLSAMTPHAIIRKLLHRSQNEYVSIRS